METYDVSTKKTFQMDVVLMWIINDFPRLGNLSRWNTYTGLARPICNFHFDPQRLPCSKKWCFMCHHHFLDTSHRFKLNKSWFNGNIKLRDPPNILFGSQVLVQLENINVIFGKVTKIKERGKRSQGTLVDESETW